MSGTSTRWTGDSGINLDTTLMRLLFALRFRDLNLLISDQVTNESQLLFDRAIAQRLPKIAPFLRYDKDPYIVVDEATGGLVYVQDAYTVSDRFPQRELVRPRRARIHEPRWRGVQLHPQQRQGHDRRVHRHDDVLRRRSERSDRADVCKGLPEPVPAADGHAREPPDTSALPGGAVQRPDPDVRAIPRHDTAAVLPERRPVDGARGPDDRADPPVRGVLRDHADARRTQGRVPAPAADGPA